MLLRKRNCPVCDGNHGLTTWAVANSAAYAPVRCKTCGGNSHHSGWRWWFVMPVVAPWIGLHSLGWPIALGLVLLGVLAVSVYVGRCLPLVSGPRHG